MFNINIPFYSIAIILSLFSNVIIVLLFSQKYKTFNNNEIVCLLLYENIGIIFGAKFLSFLLSYEKFNGQFKFLNVGLSSYGAIIGATLFLFIFSIQFKKNFKDIIFMFLPSMPLMYSIGKIGCFLAGCCYGIKYNGLGKIMYYYSNEAPNNIYLFPVQLIESLIFFVIFLYLIRKQYTNKLTNKSFGICLIMCGISKFIMDFFRMNYSNTILSVNKIISIFVIIVGIIIVIKNQANKKHFIERP